MTVKLSLDPRRMPDGVILLASIRYDQDAGAGGVRQVEPIIYTYAMLKAKGMWYVTGGVGRVPTAAGWGAVERWLDRDGRVLLRMEVVTGMQTIWPEPVEPSPV